MFEPAGSGLLFAEMGRSDTELAAGAKEQLGEKGIPPAAEERQSTPLSDLVCVEVHMLCAKLRALIFVFICTWLDTVRIQFACNLCSL